MKSIESQIQTLDAIDSNNKKLPESLAQVNDNDIGQITDYYYSKYKSKRRSKNRVPASQSQDPRLNLGSAPAGGLQAAYIAELQREQVLS